MKRKLMAFVIMAALFLSGCSLKAETTAPSATSDNDSIPIIAPTLTDSGVIDAEEPAVPVATVSGYQVGTIQAFDQQKFDAAMADRKTVFLDFYAPWCPTCRANEPIVDGAFEGTDVVGFRVDYDSSEDLRKKYSVVSQSTYIVFRRGKEVDRYLGLLTADKMADLLKN